ncbi:MAG TPA: ferredoxin [Candidatus Methylomirabilis sp.]|nr:ferredoxin [Candidatus Methylomirabilis sp.]
MKIVVDQNTCIGAASCVAIAEKTFGLNREGKVYILNEAATASETGSLGDAVSSAATPAMNARDTIIAAAQSCPTKAITLYEDDGTEVPL